MEMCIEVYLRINVTMYKCVGVHRQAFKFMNMYVHVPVRAWFCMLDVHIK